MSDPALPDDDSPADIVDVDVRSWVEEASANPTLHRDRQVTEILLAAIGLSANLKDVLVLKGGTLMPLAFASDRVTSDVDFTAPKGPTLSRSASSTNSTAGCRAPRSNSAIST